MNWQALQVQTVDPQVGIFATQGGYPAQRVLLNIWVIRKDRALVPPITEWFNGTVGVAPVQAR
jgi:hypothetical protein